MLSVGLGVAVVAGRPTRLPADITTLDEFLTQGAYNDDVQKVGLSFLMLDKPGEQVHVWDNFSHNYWATRPGAAVPPERLAAETDRLRRMLADVRAAIAEYAPKELIFVGLDRLAVWKCQDWYYMAVTDRGPLLIRVSVAYNGRPLLMQFEAITGWDKIKATLAGIQFKAGDRVMGITYVPPPTTRPDDHR